MKLNIGKPAFLTFILCFNCICCLVIFVQSLEYGVMTQQSKEIKKNPNLMNLGCCLKTIFEGVALTDVSEF